MIHGQQLMNQVAVFIVHTSIISSIMFLVDQAFLFTPVLTCSIVRDVYWWVVDS